LQFRERKIFWKIFAPAAKVKKLKHFYFVIFSATPISALALLRKILYPP